MGHVNSFESTESNAVETAETQERRMESCNLKRIWAKAWMSMDLMSRHMSLSPLLHTRYIPCIVPRPCIVAV